VILFLRGIVLFWLCRRVIRFSSFVSCKMSFIDRTGDLELVAWLVLESVRRTYVGIGSDLRGNANRVTGNDRKIGRE